MARNRLKNLTARAQENAVADDKYKVHEEDTPLIDVVNELKIRIPLKFQWKLQTRFCLIQTKAYDWDCIQDSKEIL